MQLVNARVKILQKYAADTGLKEVTGIIFLYEIPSPPPKGVSQLLNYKCLQL